MKRYFDLNKLTDNNYCDDLESHMVLIPDDGKPYGLVDGNVVDISGNDEYKDTITSQERAIKISNLQAQIEELDKKRIRAGFEPTVKDIASGQTWLEYYTLQIQDLRAQIVSL